MIPVSIIDRDPLRSVGCSSWSVGAVLSSIFSVPGYLSCFGRLSLSMAPGPVLLHNPMGGPGREPSTLLTLATILRPEGTTGVHTHIRELRRFLDRQGAAVTLLTPYSWGGGLQVPVFAARRLLTPASGDASVLWYRHWHEYFIRHALHRHLASGEEAVVYCQSPVEARAALATRHGSHQRIVMAVHFPKSHADEWVRKGMIKEGGNAFRKIRRMEQEVIPHLDGIVYVSRSARDELYDWLPKAAAVPSAVIPNFIGPPIPRRTPEVDQADLVNVGALDFYKNQRYLLEVLAAASRLGKHLTLDVFGEGPLRSQLHALAGELGVSEQVRFRGYHADISSRLSGYKAYVHAGAFETGPLVVIEAMAAGVPVVAGSAGSVTETFRDGVEGRFWSLTDPQSAAATLTELLEDESVRSHMGVAARERFESTFAAAVVAPRLVSFLESGEGASPGADPISPSASRLASPNGNIVPSSTPQQPVRGRSGAVRRLRHVVGNATIRLNIAPRWSKRGRNPARRQTVPDAPLYGLIATWHEADVIGTTVANAFSQGCQRVFIVDNDSPDDTVEQALQAGAEIARVYQTEYYDEERRLSEVAHVITRTSESTPLRHIWWLCLDADEFPHGPGGLTVAEYVGQLDKRFRVVGARVFDHYPSGEPPFVPGRHPLDYQSLCQEVMIRSCALDHWKHPLIRWDRAGPPVLPSTGFHRAVAPSRLLEPDPGIFLHHVQYRDSAATFERLRLLCDGTTRGFSRASLDEDRQGRQSNAQRRRATLEHVYAGRWELVDRPVMRGHKRGVNPRPWSEQVPAADTEVRRWYSNEEDASPSPVSTAT